MKNTKGIIILLSLIVAGLLALSVFLTVQLLKQTHDHGNPTNTSNTTTASTSEPAGTTTTASTASEATSAETTQPTSQPSTSGPEVTTTAPNIPGLITAEQAKAIALSQFDSNVSVLEVENHTDDSPPHYELELTDGYYDYALKIHAVTGAVIDYEREPVEGDESETED
jgi:uncharacterized membrane protein YkoI